MISTNIPDNARRCIAVVDSETSAIHYYEAFAYRKLVLFTQFQALSAGIPFRLITETDLACPDKLEGISCLIAPSMAFVPSPLVEEICRSIESVREQNTLGIIVSGNFLTNDQNGIEWPTTPYRYMERLLGVTRADEVSGKNVGLYTTSQSKLLLKNAIPRSFRYHTFQKLDTDIFRSSPRIPGDALATYAIGAIHHKALLVTNKGGRNIHFSCEQLLTASDLLWRAIQLSVFDTKPAVSLRPGRQRSIFTARIDMDKSGFPETLDVAGIPLAHLLKEWKRSFGFVASCYINITGKTPEGIVSTDWEKSSPVYENLLGLGNEIGTHSYNHPFNVSVLSEEELQFEFGESRRVIEAQLEKPVRGAAIPGLPEALEVHDTLEDILDYVSGRYSGPDTPHPNAIGFLRANRGIIYFCMNVLPDFTAFSHLNWSTERVTREWLEQYQWLMNQAPLPVIHCLWHDYGLTESVEGYETGMYEILVSRAAEEGAEFITVGELETRIRSFCKASYSVTWVTETELVLVVNGTGLGCFSIQLDCKPVIHSVESWYAYSGRQIFLPYSGGQFRISLDDTPADVTRVDRIPMRAELIATAGDGRELRFVLQGEGLVGVNLHSGFVFDIYSDSDVQAQQEGDYLWLYFESDARHAAEIRIENSP